jgi:hypothetical protein
MTQHVIDEIDAERARQDVQWGGPAHDDQHHPDEWIDYINKQARAGWLAAVTPHPVEYRERLVKIAALAVAALESMTRISASGRDPME